MQKIQSESFLTATIRYWQARTEPDESDVLPLDLFADRFDRVEKLGAGAFGEVWKVKDRLLDRDFALKVSRDPLVHEVRLLRQLPDDTFIRSFDFLSERGFFAYTMEMMETPWITLEDYMEWRTGVPADLNPEQEIRRVKAAYLVCRELLEALSALHGVPYARKDSYCHGDLSPGSSDREVFSIAQRLIASLKVYENSILKWVSGYDVRHRDRIGASVCDLMFLNLLASFPSSDCPELQRIHAIASQLQTDIGPLSRRLGLSIFVVGGMDHPVDLMSPDL